MLKDMLRVDVFDGVVGSVDVWVAILKRSLEHERCWEPITSGTTVIGACVTALALNICNVSVLRLR
jgi:hypothetical protein